LTGIGASEVHETGKQTILGWNKSRQDELFLKVGTKMSAAMKHMSAIPSEKRAALLEQCVTDSATCAPKNSGRQEYFTLPPSLTPSYRERNNNPFLTGLLLRPESSNRHALTTVIFRLPEPAAADSLGDARENVVNIAKSSDGEASAQLKPIVEGLAEHPKFVLLATGQADWQSPLNAIVETGSRLSPGDRQVVHKNLNDSLDMIEQISGSVGIDAARERLKALEPL
jgi:hypothetical protein